MVSPRSRSRLEKVDKIHDKILDEIADFENDVYQKYIRKNLDKREQQYFDGEFEDIYNMDVIYELKDIKYTEFKIERIFEDIYTILVLKEIDLKNGALQEYEKYKKSIRKMYKDLYKS